MPDTDTAIATLPAPANLPDAMDWADWENVDGFYRPPPTPKDWEPLRALARKRAYITLKKAWEDVAAGKCVWHVNYHRFCYRDYGIRKPGGSFAIMETPYSISFNHQGPRQSSGSRKLKFHYCVSFKKQRVSFYRKRGGTVSRLQPCRIDLLPVIRGAVYPEVQARFEKRVVKMVRAKARANGVRLPKGVDLQAILTDAIYPGLSAVREQHQILRGMALEMHRSGRDRWILRHLHCPPSVIVKSMTGYNSRVVTRLFWEAMKNLNWRSKWCWLALLRRWLPVDFTQAILRAPKIADWDDGFTNHLPKIRAFIKQWTPQQVVRALTDTAADSFTILDTFSMLETRQARHRQPQEIPRTRGPKELHDWLAIERNQVWEQERVENERRRLAGMTPEEKAAQEAREAAEKAPFEHRKELLAVHGKVVHTPDGLTHTIILPGSTEELNTWGSTLHNCIGGYSWRVRSKDGAILGVRTEGEPGGGRPVHWGIELLERKIVQFRGTCNENAPDALRAAVEKALVEAGLVQDRDQMDALIGAAAVAMGFPRELAEV